MTPRQARKDLTDTLHLDLIGPQKGGRFEDELLSETPTSWYLAGYLVPTTAGDDLRLDDEVEDEIDAAPEAGGYDDDAPVDRSASGNNYLPSSMGMTTIIPANAKAVSVTVEWGDYIEEVVEEKPIKDGKVKKVYGYRRIQFSELVEVPIDSLDAHSQTLIDVPTSKVRKMDSRGLMLSCIARKMPQLESNCKALTIFLVNYREIDAEHSYRSCAFQAALKVNCNEGLIGRPDLRGTAATHLVDSDNSIADLHYRDVLEYAVGHGTSVDYTKDEDAVRSVFTTWLPTHEVERVIPSNIDQVEFRMFTLAAFESADELANSLTPLVSNYRTWIDEQSSTISTLDTKARQGTAITALAEARSAADRIAKGIELLRTNHDAYQAFILANKCMGEAADRRLVDVPREKVSWRPFQLAFVLLNLPSLIDPKSTQREYVELLFFPTGGGKTEAYLGLAGFQLVFRRLTNPGIRSAGLSVLMRYTLRLLTLDQLSRAAALICALELERRERPEALGEWPFEIGLWVGAAATPNRLGRVGYNGPGADQTAYIRTKRFRENSAANQAPIPLESCPWCNTKFGKGSFKMIPNEKAPTHLKISCHNYECEFSQGAGLPILTVDETIYRRLPSFLIATVDKFASLPWEGRAGALFGRVNRYDDAGFYGPTDPASMGTKMHDILPGPDIIIQDELHLISGPLGTIAGVYETAIEKLSERFASDGRQRKLPKIIASTATVRRANHQIQALFGKSTTKIFPPPGVNRADSFFAETIAIDVDKASTNGRLYLGVAAQGRSLKRVLLRTMLTLMSRAETLYESGEADIKEIVDPYMTTVGYFNSLRELGGSRRIVEDEVLMQLNHYSNRRRLDPKETLFSDRTIDMDHIKELTSRVSTNEVSSTKEKMGKPHSEGLGCDVVLATNMISVGLDITRLGLMVVLGQPKGSSEYIQATSRVGREAKKPGLVIALLNPHKPRDRSHFEQFKNYHQSFYRSVEATSVTPFSPRALDRALTAALVGVIRHSLETMTTSLGATSILDTRLDRSLEEFCILFAERARDHRPDLDKASREEQYNYVLKRCRRIVDDWRLIANDYRTQQNINLKYQKHEDGKDALPLLHNFLDSELTDLPAEFMLFRANRSMRDVESNTELKIKELNEPLTNQPKHLLGNQSS